MQYFLLWPKSPYWARTCSLSWFHDHTQRRDIRQGYNRHVIDPTQRPLTTRQSQETDIGAADGIRTHNPSQGPAADPRFRSHGHWHRYRIYFNFLCLTKSGIRVAGWRRASACNTDTTPTQPHRNSKTHRSKNNTTDVVIQQNSRKLLMMDILMSETCWAHKKWNKIASNIKLVFYSSTIVK